MMCIFLLIRWFSGNPLCVLEGNQLWERWVNYQEAHFVIAETGLALD